jgi:hypothetical protein
MDSSSALLTLATYLAGEFDNRSQAIADPSWYVHLRLWHRPVPLFTADSVTLFAEQANVLTIDRPYRQRLLRLQPLADEASASLQVQYYGFKDPTIVRGAGLHPERLQAITVEAIELLPGCVLQVNQPLDSDQHPRFSASPPTDARCCFTYEGEIRQVALGFEASGAEFLSYDRGIDPATGKALWGAILGPYKFIKQQSLPIQPPIQTSTT